MPRLTFPTPETMTPEQRRVHDRVVAGPRGRIVGPLRAALLCPELAERWQALGAFLRYQTTLTPRQSELAILVTGRACRSPFEWHAHVAEALKAGVEPALIDDLLAERVPAGLADDERLVVEFARELNATNSVGDATYAATLARFGERTVVELTALVGYYTMVAMTLNAHEIPLPDGAAPAFELPHAAGRAGGAGGVTAAPPPGNGAAP
jgi:4-carboxymuconolactone decarboxylase